MSTPLRAGRRCAFCDRFFRDSDNPNVCASCLDHYHEIVDGFTPWDEVQGDAGDEPPWLLRDYLASGCVTMLAGKPKAGKSTFAWSIAEAVDDPETILFLDRVIGNGPVVYVSEEGAVTLASKLAASSQSVVLARDKAWPKPSWPLLVNAAVEKAQDLEAVLLVIDSLSFWGSFKDGQAKDSGGAQAALDALSCATNAGLAVLLVHHQRKAGGEDGDAVRDSNAIVGAVDLLVELEKLGESAPATHRRLVAIGRFPETPPVLVIERDPSGSYRFVRRASGRGAAAALSERDRLLAVMPEGRPLTEDEVAGRLELDKRKISDPLRKLVAQDLVARTGEGKKGDPYLYEKLPQKLPPVGAATTAENAAPTLREGSISSNGDSDAAQAGAERAENEVAT